MRLLCRFLTFYVLGVESIGFEILKNDNSTDKLQQAE
jgi:hypothetical protein